MKQEEAATSTKAAKRSSRLFGALSKRFSKLSIQKKDTARPVDTEPYVSPGHEHAATATATPGVTGHASSESQLEGATQLSKFESLPDDILADIARILWRDPQPEGYLPEAEQKGGGVNELLAQPDLATLMRVSSRLQDVIGPVLYSDIITDNIPSLLHGALKGATGWNATSARKRALLTHCRSLVLEPSRVFVSERNGVQTKGDHMLREAEILTKTLELAVATGGFDALFPRLERFSTSVYTGKERHDLVYGTLWQDMTADPLYAAWYAFMKTCNAPVRCSDIMRHYPMPGPAPDPLNVKPQPVERIKPANTRRDPINFVHLHYGSRPLDIRYNIKTVYLVSVGTYLALDPRMHLLTWLTNHAHDILRRAESFVPGTTPGDARDLHLDIEFRIPIVFIREFVTDIDALFAGNLQRIRDWYTKEGGKCKRVRDSWTIRVMDVVHCPACKTTRSRYEVGMEDCEHYVKSMTYEHGK